MCEQPQESEMEFELRRAFGALVDEALPAAARARGWPVAHPAAFERLLLDHVLDAPFERALAGRGPGPLELAIAVEMAAGMLEGRVCVDRMHRRSQALRAGEPSGVRAADCAGAVDALIRGAAPGRRGR